MSQHNERPPSLLLVTNLSQWAKWQAAWSDLVSNSTALEARLFLSYEWLTSWWRFLGRGQLLVLAVRDGNHLLAAAPLFAAPSPLVPFARLLRFVGNGNADYGDFLARRGYEESVKELWQWLFTHRSLWDLIALHELPEESVAWRSLKTLPYPHEIGVVLLQGEKCHRVPLDRTNGNWRQRASKRLQQQLKRRERQLERLFNQQLHCAQTPEEVEEGMVQLFALHRLRWGQLGQTGVFLSPKVRSFHRAFARVALQRGWLRLYRLLLNGTIASVYYAFHCDGYAGFYTCGFHPAFSRYSVGKVLLAKLIDEAEREGAAVFDFMRGNETYKAEFGTLVAHNYHLFVWQKGRVFSCTAAALHRLSTQCALRVKTAFQR